MEKATSLVIFNDVFEDNADPHYGILFENGNVLCFCCGGVLEEGDYEIIENFNGFENLDRVLKEYY